MERELTKEEREAINFFNLEYAESSDGSGDWFCYTDCFDLHPDYPGSSCECVEDVLTWYKKYIQKWRINK